MASILLRPRLHFDDDKTVVGVIVLKTTMDINCDMGESFGNWVMGDDKAMMSRITTANVACGFHASDPVTMIETVKLAKNNDVVIGSHPGLPDLLGFGRRAMNITPEDAYAYMIYQTGALDAALRTEGMSLHHIKPHGAFYSILKDNTEIASAVADAICALSTDPILYWPAPTSAALPSEAKKRGVRVVGEIYPDLQYAPDGTLIIQREKHVTDVSFASEQVELYVTSGSVKAVDGSLVELDAESICVHGDGPNAVEVADAINNKLKDLNCDIKAIVA